MRAAYRVVALLLALVWGPVTMCCALEASGITVPCCGPQCDDDGKGEAVACNVVEEGRYESTVPLLKVMPPVVTCACLICVVERPTSDEKPAPPGYDDRPRSWVPIWQFERRAAAPAHAPDSILG